jgi:hypothetical protein
MERRGADESLRLSSAPLNFYDQLERPQPAVRSNFADNQTVQVAHPLHAFVRYRSPSHHDDDLAGLYHLKSIKHLRH